MTRRSHHSREYGGARQRSGRKKKTEYTCRCTVCKGEKSFKQRRTVKKHHELHGFWEGTGSVGDNDDFTEDEDDEDFDAEMGETGAGNDDDDDEEMEEMGETGAGNDDNNEETGEMMRGVDTGEDEGGIDIGVDDEAMRQGDNEYVNWIESLKKRCHHSGGDIVEGGEWSSEDLQFLEEQNLKAMEAALESHTTDNALKANQAIARDYVNHFKAHRTVPDTVVTDSWSQFKTTFKPFWQEGKKRLLCDCCQRLFPEKHNPKTQAPLECPACGLQSNKLEKGLRWYSNLLKELLQDIYLDPSLARLMGAHSEFERRREGANKLLLFQLYDLNER